MTDGKLRRTPLFAAHQRLGGKLIEFGGWEMPVQYTSIVDEHLAVRKAAGLFDISHMGEELVTGTGAEEFLNRTLTNDIRKLAVGQGQYTLMCHETGGVIDDLYAYRLESNSYLLIINASRISEDVAWLEKQLAGRDAQNPVRLQNSSDATGALAVQGPRVGEFINPCFPGPCSTRRRGCAGWGPASGTSGAQTRSWVSRTGYTGEDGFEIVAPAERMEAIWDRLLEAGHPHGLKPAGLGARDTLRTEMCYPLYGHELDEATTPIEAGLGSFVSMAKGHFVGHTVLAEQKLKGVGKQLIAFKMTDKSAPPRSQYAIWGSGKEGAKMGEVTSGTQSPSLGIGIGMGYVPPQCAAVETPVEIEIRGKRAPGVVVQKPIYRKVN